MWKKSTVFSIFILYFISSSIAMNDNLLNIQIVRSVPKSEAKNLISADDVVQDVSENPGGGDGPSSTPVNGTSKEGCLNIVANTRAMCCLQYTWPGYVTNPQLTTTKTPRNCSDVKALDKNAVCFGPIVYANSTTTRPDPAEVNKICEADSHDCYCPGGHCITYIVYENTDGEPRKNETHFCGTVRLKNTGGTLDSGCHKETDTKSGFIHEVCICKDEPFCNHSSSINLISITMLFICFINLKIFDFFFFFNN